LFREKVTYILIRARHGLVVDSNTRFSDFADRWMEVHENNLTPSTYARYKALLERINTAIGHMKLSDLQSHPLAGVLYKPRRARHKRKGTVCHI